MLLHEFAVEPSLIKCFQNARYLLGSLGPKKGRLLAKYPAKWKRAVYQSLNCTDVEKKKIVELLNLLEKKTFVPRPNASWDDADDWLSQAIDEDARTDVTPFQAIIADNPKVANPKVIDGNFLTDDKTAFPLWCVETDMIVSRNATDMAKAVSLLLQNSNIIKFQDPYFAGNKADKTGPIIAFIQAALSKRRNGETPVFEIHTSRTSGAGGRQRITPFEVFKENCEKHFKPRLPPGVSIRIHCWNEKSGGEQFHDRYIFTDICGVEFPAGLDERTAETSTRLSLLTPDIQKKIENRLAEGADVYDVDNEPFEL